MSFLLTMLTLPSCGISPLGDYFSLAVFFSSSLVFSSYSSQSISHFLFPSIFLLFSITQQEHPTVLAFQICWAHLSQLKAPEVIDLKMALQLPLLLPRQP
uniref:Uncharacterized protein n=1 Tax=Opuntia streptacantha TaxID=393608 RepID=A0A7C9DF85_OPUST